ncbi:DUF3108 domain-containing protein [Algoriphagus hitonicola]|uniref:DUF3108 domain-containing protein n=1 Tax=Algoriphagus hitonicola TaxID=435880 RepID=A0A1I2WGB9_9BACT|nr:DUF3108 domain-containing protein [Algoriphagus hitonicola]SFG98611.1 Protein of unknown function [Algoriphagus hitonicola]
MIQFRLLLLFFLLPTLGLTQQAPTVPFTFGEELNFEVSYGWINLADAKMQVSNQPHIHDQKPHYKIDVYGQTKGAAALFGRVNDNWGTYWDGDTRLPKISYRHIEEGKYRKHEKVFFDQKNRKAKMQLFDRENKVLTEVKEFDLPGQVQDLVSGFYYLRSLDLRDIKAGDYVTIKGFFDKEIYNIKLIFEGTERIKTELGEKDTFIFSPQVPKNKLFRGEYPVKVWVTQDQNKIPVKIKANLFLGSLNFDIISAKGLRYN